MNKRLVVSGLLAAVCLVILSGIIVFLTHHPILFAYFFAALAGLAVFAALTTLIYNIIEETTNWWE